MSFKQIIINTNAHNANQLSDIFIDLNALSVNIEDEYSGTENEQAIFNEPDSPETDLWNNSKLTVLFNENSSIKELADQAKNLLGSNFNYTTELIDDQDWVKLCQDQFAPIKVTETFYIVPSWHKPPKTDALNLTLDPGLAFGTGAHPTTLMCLQWIANNVEKINQTFLDYGCGSGILALAAKKLGVKLVYGTDIDEQAVEASINNAKLNNLDISFSLVNQFKLKQFDTVVANILSNPLRILAPHLAVLTQKRLILSGILNSQSDGLSTIYSSWFNVKTYQIMDEWVLLECNKK